MRRELPLSFAVVHRAALQRRDRHDLFEQSVRRTFEIDCAQHSAAEHRGRETEARASDARAPSRAIRTPLVRERLVVRPMRRARCQMLAIATDALLVNLLSVALALVDLLEVRLTWKFRQHQTARSFGGCDSSGSGSVSSAVCTSPFGIAARHPQFGQYIPSRMMKNRSLPQLHFHTC